MKPRAVVSFPKSGRTWLRFILDELRVDADYSHAGAVPTPTDPYPQLNISPLTQYERIILLLRDPRDTVVSWYHHSTKRLLPKYEGTISDFIRNPNYGIQRIVEFHVLWLGVAAQHRNVRVLRYEDMHRDVAAVIAEALSFFGESRPTGTIQRAIVNNTFEELQRRERSNEFDPVYRARMGTPNPDDLNSLKFRRGVVGSYRYELSPADIAYCDSVYSLSPAV